MTVAHPQGGGAALRPPVHYYGGKARLAPWIVSLMPEHRVYVEPFFGSGSVFFAKPPSRFEILNDLDGNVVNFFRVLRTQFEDLERACALTPHARQEHEDCHLDFDCEDPVERARRWWVRCTQGFGKLPGRSGWSLSTRMGAPGPRNIEALVGRFAGTADRLKNASIEHADACTVIGRSGNEPDALIYADPPYLGTTRAGLAKRPKDYDHDFSDEAGHRRLADALHDTAATVLLSGYHSALYDDLYGDWSRTEREVYRHASRLRGSSAETATEVIWSNRPLAVREPDLTLDLLQAATG